MIEEAQIIEEDHIEEAHVVSDEDSAGETQAFNGAQATPELILKILPMLDYETAKDYAKRTIAYPAGATIIMGDSTRDEFNSEFYLVVVGSAVLGFNLHEEGGRFAPFHEVHASAEKEITIMNGVYFPIGYPTNDFTLKAGRHGALVVRMSSELVESIVEKTPNMRDRYEEIQRVTLEKMLFSIADDSENAQIVVLTALSEIVGKYFLDKKNVTNEMPS